MSSGSPAKSLAERLSDDKLLKIELQQGVCVVRFVEPMLRDADRLHKVKKVLGQLAGEYDRFVVNMAVVRYCSSLVLGALVLLRNTLHQRGGEVHVCGITGQVEELFDVTDMNTLFQLYADEQDAIAALTDLA